MTGEEWCEKNLNAETKNLIFIDMNLGDDFQLRKLLVKAFQAGKNETNREEWCEKNLNAEIKSLIFADMSLGDDFQLRKLLIKAFQDGKNAQEEILTE